MKKRIFYFLIIMFSYIAFGTTTYDYYYYRVLPGDYVNKHIGDRHNYISTSEIYGDTHETATCTGPDESDLPDNLNVITESDPEEPGNQVYIRGFIIPANSDNNDKISTSTSTSKSENEILGTTEYIFHDTFRYQVDDYADSPQSTKISSLPVMENWSDNNWSNGYLFAEESWNGKNIPADIDVFKIVTPEKIELDPGVYCVETEVNNLNASFGLEINLYNADTFNDNTKMQFMTDTYEGYNNRYDDNGQLDNIGQRLYFKNDQTRTCYIEVKHRISIPEISDIEYKIRVLKARPVILVHGIECWPKIKDDLETGNNSMGHWNDYLSYDANCYPCICYNFLWDSKNNDLEYNPSGNSKIKEIVDCNVDKNPSVVQLEKLHNMDVVIIGHSMGGYIVRYALSDNDSLSKIHKAITLGDPHYGSDIAFIPNCKLIAWFKRTSEINLMALRRGSDFVWNMHNWGGKNKLVCLAGYDAPPRIPSWLGYTKGLDYSDGVVPVPSAFVIGADNAMKLRADHGTVALATYVSQDKYPFDPDPPGALGTFIERIFGNNKGQNRISPELIIGNSKYNKVYKKVRDYIKP